ncbi:MAG TPA: ring-hydroxylating oxygenase subunit alpha [Xanthobacteraceae bacterium]|nr:ring-hydroxylating oxygenase subunit alpha [Xanthobacteraceae bacterium]
MLAHPDIGFKDGGVDFVQAQTYSACCEEFGAASRLPHQAYTSAVFQDLENEKVWTRDWVCVGTLSEIINPADLLPYTVGQHAIHVQRAQSGGGLIGRFNKAQHGGCRAIPAQCRTGRKTKCSYTSCGFSRDRDVIAGSQLGEMTPQAGQFLGVYPERLLPVKVHCSGPFIFVNVDPTLGADVRPPSVEFAADRQAVRVGGHWREYLANWKLAGAALVDTARSRANGGGADSCISAEWCFPNLVTIKAGNVALAIVIQPTGFDRALWRLSAFKDDRCTDAAYDRAYADLIGLIEQAAATALSLQAAAERAMQDDVVEPSRAAWEFNQQLVQRISAHHVAYWNEPLTQAHFGR